MFYLRSIEGDLMVKCVCGSYYAHKTNVAELMGRVRKIVDPSVINSLLFTVDHMGVDYDIIKVSKNGISLIQSEDWDIRNEPSVGRSYFWKLNDVMHGTFLTYKVIKPRGQIYHNKWQFVSDTYDGFNIEEAKQRTLLWNSIPNIKAYKSRIGSKKFWEELLAANNIPI